MRSSLESGDTQYVDLLASIDAGSDAHSVLYHGAKSYASSLSVNASSIPADAAPGGPGGHGGHPDLPHAAQGTAEIVVGVPIPSVHAAYFEVFDLSDLDHTLRVLGLTLFVAGVVTTLLGVALGPLRQPAARCARWPTSRGPPGAIAGGELDTRLDADAADPDLEGLTNSFNTMVDQLQARIEREARFNSDVSHELRSPLTTLAAAARGARGRPRRAARRARSGPCSSWATTCAASSAWWATCSRCRGPTPARSTCSSRRSTSPSWCSARSRPASGTWTAPATGDAAPVDRC